MIRSKVRAQRFFSEAELLRAHIAMDEYVVWHEPEWQDLYCEVHPKGTYASQEWDNIDNKNYNESWDVYYEDLWTLPVFEHYMEANERCQYPT